MKSHTVYKTFEIPERRSFVRITDDVQAAVDEAGIAEGMALVSAMHITAGVWVNDDEPGPPRRHAGVARQAGAAELAGAGERGGAGALTRPRRLPPPRAAARTTATPT